MKLFSVKDVWQCQNYATAIFLPVEAFRGTHKTRLIRMLPIFQILTKKNCNSASFWITGYHFVVSNFLSPLSLVSKSFCYCNGIMVSFKIFKGEGNADIFVRKNDRLVSARRRKESPTLANFLIFFFFLQKHLLGNVVQDISKSIRIWGLGKFQTAKDVLFRNH